MAAGSDIKRGPGNRHRTVAIATTLVVVILGGLTSPEVRDARSVLATPGSVVAVGDPGIAAAIETDGTAAVVVQVRRGDIEAARRVVREHGGAVRTELPIIDGFAATITRGALEELSTAPGVILSLDREVDVNLLGGLLGTGDGGTTSSTAPTTPADSSYVETIGAHRLHRAGITGAGVGIAVLDTGVSPVGDLKGRIVGALDLAADGDHVDHYGHGTFVAGVAAGSGAASRGNHAGVAPGAHIVPIKIAGRDGAADVTHVLAGIQYAVSFMDELDIAVLNLSLGTDSTQSSRVDPLNYAVQRAWDAGLVVVVSGANRGPGPRTITKPADDPLVITVGTVDAHATSDRADDTMSDFSSRGPTVTDGLVKPDLVAPGVSVVGLRVPNSFIDRNHPYGRVETAYFRGSGTSFSAAVVTGAVALLRQAHPDWTPDMVKGALMATAAPGPVGSANVDGAGSVDVAAAANLTTPPSANVGVARSDGSGSLDASRGSLSVQITVDTLVGLLGNVIQSVTSVLTGEKTAQDVVFDRAAYGAEWTKASWYKASWYKASWYKASWYKASWYKASWYGNYPS